jgi:hypothetical protein
MGAGACPQRRCAILAEGCCGHRHHGGLSCRGVGTQRPRRLDAVHDGHAQVQQDQVRTPIGAPREGIATIQRRVQIEPEGLQHAPDYLSVLGLVIRDRDSY